MKKLFPILFFLLIVNMALFAGGQNEVSEQSYEIDKEITLATARDIVPGESDFFFASSLVKLWEPLVGVNEAWEPIPVLAESWESTKDAREWTFYLRKGVQFHDGAIFNADAVMKNFIRYQVVNPGKSKFYSFSIQRFYPGFEKIEKVDDYTVKIYFENPTPSLPYFMSNFGSAMFSPDCFDETGMFTKTAAGTGPFIVTDHVIDQYEVLERNANYWGDAAKAKTIRIKVIPDGNTRFSALKAEEIQGVLDIGAIQPNLAKQLIKDERFSDSIAKSSIIHYIGVNGTSFPFNDIRMKQAVSLIFDRQMIADTLYSGYVSPAPHILNYSSPFYKSMNVEYNPTKAKALAEKVLGSRRLTMDLIVPSSFLNRYPYKEQAEYLQSIAAELGIDLQIKLLEWGAFREAQKNGDYGLSLQIQGLPSGEPYAIFDSFMRSDGGQNKSYSLGYFNPGVDKLLNEASLSTDMKKRGVIYDELQEISSKEFPFIPLFNDATVLVYNKQLKGYNAEIYGLTIEKVAWDN